MKKLLFISLLLSIILLPTSCKKNSTPDPDPNPDPDPQQEVEVNPKTKVAPDVASLAIVEIDSNYNFTVMPGNEYFDNLEKGDIMVAGVSDKAPYGYLRKVVSIENDDSGLKTIKTEKATLIETCKVGSVHFSSGDVKISQIQKIELAKGVKLVNSKDPNFTVFDFDINKDIDFNGVNVNLNGASSLKMNLFFNFDWSVEFDLDWVPISFNVDLFETGVKVDQSSSIAVTIEDQLQYNKAVDLATFYLQPITFFIGPIPVVFVPKVVLSADMNGNVSAMVKISASENFKGKLGVKYDDDGWGKIAEKTVNTDYSAPVMDASTESNVGVGPLVNIMLYGIVGPYAMMDGCVGLNAEPNGENWNLDLNVGLRYNVGIQVDVLGFDEDWSLSDEPICLFKKNLMHLDDEPLGNNIYITAPADNSNIILGSQANITTYYTGDKPDKVIFYIDGTQVAEDAEEPFEYEWNTAGTSLGQHELKVSEIIDGEEASNDVSNVNITIQTWEMQDLSSIIGANPMTLDVFFFDENIGWISATNSMLDGILLKTTNGGATWSKVHSQAWEGPLMQFVFNGESDGVGLILGGNQCMLLKDGGATFKELIPDGGEYPTFEGNLLWNFAMSPVDGTMNVIATGTEDDDDYHFYIYKVDLVDNKIIDSTSVPENTHGGIINIVGEKGLVCGLNRNNITDDLSIMVSDDGGQSWSTKTLSGLEPLDAVRASSIVNENVMYMVGAHYESYDTPVYAFVAISTDGGDSWEKVEVPDAVGFSSISMVSAEKGYASVGFETNNEVPKLYYTEDGGHTWEPVEEVKDKRPIGKVVFKGQDFGYAIDDQGVGFRFTNAK